jgi:hypothetical protein
MKHFRYIKVTTDYGDDLYRLESRDPITKDVVSKFIRQQFTEDDYKFQGWEFANAPAIYAV